MSSNEPIRVTAAPFAPAQRAPVAGGTIAFAQAGPPLHEASGVVLAIHGVTGNMIAWSSVARAMGSDSRIAVVAPDLRGRGDSASLPGPYGMAAHVADMLALLDHLGIDQAVLAGHSMGAYTAARLAAEHAERAAALVLVDGGVPIRELGSEAAAAVRVVVIGPAVARHALTFQSTTAYIDFMRQHPAFADAWNADLEAYALHDLEESGHAFRYVMNADAVEVDCDEMLFDPANRSALDRVHAPVHVLRATRGTLDDENPMIPQAALEAFTARHPEAEVEQVPGVNHYTLVLGNSPGPARVAAAIEAATRA
jgi:lipase